MTSAMMQSQILVIGAGPAGIAAAIAADSKGQSVILIERAESAGGILNQCIHDGFGSIRFGEQLCGPEYAYKEIKRLEGSSVIAYFHTTITEIRREEDFFLIDAVSPKKGTMTLKVEAIILATGCRERSARQIFLQGDRPSGVFTAGLAQYVINCMGYLPGKRCVILGSGDIGLIMARRLTLEGSSVLGVYEIQNEPSGLSRNIVQCLNDFGIPLHLSRTVIELHGKHRLESVTIMDVDENRQFIKGSEQIITCDTLIVSVGLIPEHDMVRELGIKYDPHTSGPIVDQTYMSNVPGIFCCGNALHVNDLVDYVTESGEIAGDAAVDYLNGIIPRKKIELIIDQSIGSIIPQTISLSATKTFTLPLFIRSKRTMRKSILRITNGGNELFTKRFNVVKPPEMIRIDLSCEISKVQTDFPFLISIKEERS